MRTQEEIVSRINGLKNDFFGFETSDLVNFLTFENAKPWLKEDVGPEKFKTETMTPKEVMADYMEFAWEKANDKRGLSAARSMIHYHTWLWLDGNEELSREMLEYNCYGKENLIKVCQYLGLDHSKWDDGVRENA